MGGSLQTPYFHECSGDGKAPAFGGIGYLGIAVEDISVTAEYVTVGDFEISDDCHLPEPLANGTHQVREFPRRSSHIWAWAFHLRYATPQLPLMGYVGTGYESEGNKFLLFGAELRTRRALAVFAGAQVTLLRTPFILNEETWNNGRQVSSVPHIDEGYAWRHLAVFRAGLEYRWRVFGD
jgi:hypothetical protein